MVELVNSFMRTGKLDKQLNMTNMCMISKTERPTRMTDLRTISLCNVGYKIISKVLCQRLKVCLPKLWTTKCHLWTTKLPYCLSERVAPGRSSLSISLYFTYEGTDF